jgi:hypothetical protein
MRSRRGSANGEPDKSQRIGTPKGNAARTACKLCGVGLRGATLRRGPQGVKRTFVNKNRTPKHRLSLRGL